MELTAKNLKNSLWDTLQKLQSGKIAPAEADSVATQAREILRTTNVQLQIFRQSKRQLQIFRQSKRNVSVDVINFAEKD